MAEYAAGLSDGGIDVSALRNLTERDLERLGVAPGDRNRLLHALAAFYPDPEPAAPAEKRPDRGVERRHLTILFGDLVGSTEISTRLDPEAFHEIMGPYRKCCADAIERGGGFVARYLGDGVLAYFGYPQASEDAAECAINAGLALVKAVGQLRDDMARPLQTRVGIASGLVLIGDLVAAGAPHDHDVVGETPNLAAKVEAQAEPNMVVISGETRRLVGELFDASPSTSSLSRASPRRCKPGRSSSPAESPTVSGRCAHRAHRSSVEDRRPILWSGAGKAPKRETAKSC